MKKILTICLFEIKRTFKKKSSIVLMLGMPLLFTFLFGSVFGKDADITFRIALVDEERSELSTGIIQKLMLDEMISYELVASGEAEELLANKEVQGIVTLEKGIAHKLRNDEQPISFQPSPNMATAPLVKQQVNQAMQAIDIYVAASQVGSSYFNKSWESIYEKLNQNEGMIQAWTEQRTNDGSSKNPMMGISYSSAGFSIMFVMIMMLSMTGTLIEAKQDGIWSRLFTTPVTRFQVLLGYFLSFFIVGWIQFFLLIALSSAMFDVDWGSPAALLLLITSLLLCVVGLGMAIASFVKTVEQQNAIGTFVIISTCMLGGVYWPISMVPDIMQKIANFVPQTWAMEGFTMLIAEGGNVGDIIMPTIILLGFAVAFLSVGLSRMKVA
ncbi:ABC transporter permease [Sporosarcina thermotolerans]|uniref:ABC transporter permease n=1 Tax=Sporosarcina thermotolerans TaxID=633404 RepID=A0AAW9AG83_9BACL|nr:ABC transporter permease [Sporosarcina thermotolerans]MDW0118663.1 ABC transporter permease [Sporosarcina thermotolerans]WHT48679.1 ABC transporter permease [Sporosarcina thermotolerans]